MEKMGRGVYSWEKMMNAYMLISDNRWGARRQSPALHASCLALTMEWKMAQPCLHYLCTLKDSDVCFPQRQDIILRIAIIFSMSF